MSLTVRTNTASLKALSQLNRIQTKLSQSLGRISKSEWHLRCR